jgi:hypothetical protein
MTGRITAMTILLFLAAAVFGADTAGAFTELDSRNFKDYPYKRPDNEFLIVSSVRYREALKMVILNKSEIKLSEQGEKYRAAYEADLVKTAAYVANFFLDDYVKTIDDGLYYGYTFQDPAGALNKSYINDIAIIKQHFPDAIELSFWPWEENMKLNGLYIGSGVSSGGTLQLSLYDTFMQQNFTRAIKAQDPSYTYYDTYAAALGKMGENLAEKMPILHVFIHENTHCVFQFYNSGSYGPGNPSFLYEGITEMLSHRVVFYLAGGYEDFNDLFSYPGGTLVAGLLFAIDPTGLLDWYTRKNPDVNTAFADSLAGTLAAIKDVHSGTPCLAKSAAAGFKKAFTETILEGKVKKREEIYNVFAKYADTKILFDWLTVVSVYFRQLPLKHRLFILDNFFGCDKSERIGPSYKQFAVKVKDMLSKAERKNWNDFTEKEIMGLIADDSSSKDSRVTPVQINGVEKKNKQDDMEDLKKNAKPKILDANAFLDDGPEARKAKEKPIKVPIPDAADEANSSLPNIKEWFDGYWAKNPKGDVKAYADLRDAMINVFSMHGLDEITKIVVAGKGYNKKVISEWHAFLNDFIAPNLKVGKDSLKLNELTALKMLFGK